MKKILFQQSSTIVGIINSHDGLTTEQLIAQVPVGSAYVIVEEEDLPPKQDLRDFYEALTVDFNNPENPNVRIDLERAKKITKDRLRYERQSLFEKNDLLIRDALLEEDATAKAAAIEERDRLRDVTKLVDEAQTLDELRTIRAAVKGTLTYPNIPEVPPELLGNTEQLG